MILPSVQSGEGERELGGCEVWKGAPGRGTRRHVERGSAEMYKESWDKDRERLFSGSPRLKPRRQTWKS